MEATDPPSCAATTTGDTRSETAPQDAANSTAAQKRPADSSPEASDTKRSKSITDEEASKQTESTTVNPATKKNIFAAAVDKAGGAKGFGAGGFGIAKAGSSGVSFGAGFSGFGKPKASSSNEGNDASTGSAKNLFASAAGKVSGFSNGFGGAKKTGLFGAAAANVDETDKKGSAFSGPNSASSIFGNKITSVFGSADKLETTDASGPSQGTVFAKDAKPPSSGEENDVHAFQVANAKLWLFTETMDSDGKSKKWEYKERGKGKLTLNDAVESDGNKFSRLVLRQDTTKKLCLNARIWKGMEPTVAGKKGIRFSAANAAADDTTSVAIYLVQTSKPEECTELLSLLAERVKEAQDNAASSANTKIDGSAATEVAKDSSPSEKDTAQSPKGEEKA